MNWIRGYFHWVFFSLLNWKLLVDPLLYICVCRYHKLVLGLVDCLYLVSRHIKHVCQNFLTFILLFLFIRETFISKNQTPMNCLWIDIFLENENILRTKLFFPLKWEQFMNKIVIFHNSWMRTFSSILRTFSFIKKWEHFKNWEHFENKIVPPKLKALCD